MKRATSVRAFGGKKQRLARCGSLPELFASHGSVGGTGPLDGDAEVDVLLELWSLGLMSALLLQTIAQAACLVAPRPAMERLSHIGAEGNVRGNAHRDLQRLLHLGSLDTYIARPLITKVPLIDVAKTPRKMSEYPYPIMLPHEFLSVMYEHHRWEFNTFIQGPKPLSAFWSNIPDSSPQYTGHPAKHIDNKDKLIPLRLHGDGVPTGQAQKRSFDVISMSSLTSEPGTTWETRFFLAGVVKEAKFDGDASATSTMDKIWQILLWSFVCLSKGVWPYVDWNKRVFDDEYHPEYAKKAGQRLCGDYIFVLWQISADMDYLCNYLGLRQFNSLMPCFLCGCNRKDTPWTDLTPEAIWRQRLETLMSWRLLNDRHILFKTPAVGLNLFHICLDILHILDLGVCQHICGSVLFLMVWDTALQGDLEKRTETVWQKLLDAYDSLGTASGERYTHASFSNIFAKNKTRDPNSWIQLHSKAAVCRHTVPALHYMMRHLADWAPNGTNFIHDEEGSVTTMVSEMLRQLNLFYDCIAYHPQWMSHDAAKEVHDALLAAGCCHTSLCDFYMRKQRMLFNVTEKAHFAQHIALSTLASRYNPRFGWTYQDEDYMGKVAQVAKACAKSRGPTKMPAAFIFRWRNRMQLMWARKERQRSQRVLTEDRKLRK